MILWSIERVKAYLTARIRKIDPTGCWVWLGTKNSDGYGKTLVGRTKRGKGAQPVRRYAHRVAFFLAGGTLPEGADLDHLCRNRACVNPAHLEPVSRKENVARGLLPGLMRNPTWRPKRKLVRVCKHGHNMTGDNVRVSGGRRVCVACKRASNSRHNEKRRMRK